MKKFFSLITLIPSWGVFFLSYLVKRNKNIIVFGVHTASFSGNVKALLLEEGSTSVRKIFIGRTFSIVENVRLYGIEAHWKYSIKGIWYCLRAGSYVYSSYPADINYWLSGGAKYINVWHGTPWKKIEKDVETGYYALRNKYSFLFSMLAPYLFVKPDIILTSSEYEKKCFSSAFGVGNERFFLAFPPRLAQLVTPLSYDNEQSFNILYAPTWRDDHSFVINEYFDFAKLNALLQEKGSVLYIKLHPSDKAEITDEYTHIKVVAKEKDIYELVEECALLITDYSSMLFEYFYIGRNVLLYCPDYNDYQKNSRAFYFNVSKDFPLGISYNFESLVNAITSELNNRNHTLQIPEEYKPYQVHEHLLDEMLVRLDK